MSVARDAAPEIDRLVLSVSRGVGPLHGPRLEALAAECGLDSLDLLPYFADFLLAGRLSDDVAMLRTRYRPEGQVRARLDDLATRQLIEATATGLAATPALRPLLEAIRGAAANVAADAWGNHEGEVATATGFARSVALAASPDHVVATAHRALPEPTDFYLRLHHHLTTLRYVRQHDHIEAWVGRGLTVPAIGAMTAMWRGDGIAGTDSGLPDLVERGLASDEPPGLTDNGQTLRDEIEAETDRRADAAFAVLGGDEAGRFLDALRALPG